jgi:hypothetical protein
MQIKSLVEITQDALRVLYKEIGVVNTLRFINQFTTGYGNYTEEREKLFEGLSLDDVVVGIKQMRKHDA